MDGKSLSDGIYNIETLDVKVDGEVPNYGYVEIKDGEIIGYSLSMNNKNYSYLENNITEVDEDPMKLTSELSIDNVNHEVIKGISLSYYDKLSLNFYIDKEKIGTKKVYLKVTNQTRYLSTDSLVEEVTNYKETTRYLIFSYSGMNFTEFTNSTLFEIIDDTETVIDSITYDVSTYADNKIYTTTNDFEKDVLIALMNLGTTNQSHFNYKTDRLAYSILKDEDKNLSNLTSDGETIYNRSVALDENIINNTDERFSSLGYFNLTNFGLYINSGGMGYKIILGKKEDSTSIKLSRNNTTEEEFNKYGVLVFPSDVFNKVNDTTENYSKLNINTEGAIDLEKIYDSSLYEYPTLIYNYDMNNLNETLYTRVYYKINDDEYIYTLIKIINIKIRTCESSINDNATDTLSNFCKTLFNFMGVTE